MLPLSLSDCGMAGIAVCAVVYTTKLFVGSITPQQQKADAHCDHSDQLIDVLTQTVSHNSEALLGVTQSVRDVGQLVSLCQNTVQTTVANQVAIMEILKSIKTHCDQENIWWMEMFKRKEAI